MCEIIKREKEKYKQLQIRISTSLADVKKLSYLKSENDKKQYEEYVR